MLRRLRILTRSLLRRSTTDRELDDELQFHLDRSIELHMARGLSAVEARRQALLQFGNVTLTSEESREQQRLRVIDDLVADVRYALRTLRRSPAFTAVAVLTIALGVGANTAIFGAIDAVLLRTLPVREPEQLVFLSVATPQGTSFGGPPYPWFEQIRSNSQAYEGMAVFAVDHLPVTIDGQVEQVLSQVASGSFHEVGGVTAAIGRTLTPEDERLAPPVVVLSYRYWQRRFAGRRDVLGSLVRHNGRDFTIVGVTAREFDGLQTGQRVEITFPITTVGYDLLRTADTWWSQTIARLKTGIARETAEAETQTIFASLDIGPTSADRPNRRLRLAPAARGQDRLQRQLATPLLLLLGVVAAVLLIACANIANLLSVRAAAR
ncbi:MAG: ABC transporter permease, partial [Gemmatimonadaceae bacterium]